MATGEEQEGAAAAAPPVEVWEGELSIKSLSYKCLEVMLRIHKCGIVAKLSVQPQHNLDKVRPPPLPLPLSLCARDKKTFRVL